MNTSKIKLISALLLACCFFLPLSKCQQPVAHDTATNQPISKPEITFIYPYKALDIEDLESMFVLAVFFWPVPFLIFGTKSKKRRVIISLEIVQGLCCLLAAYYITVWACVGKPLLGAYLSWVALVGYFLSVIIGIFVVNEGSKSNQLLKRTE